MNITIIGTGYVGLTSGVCFAELGHEVTCVDIDVEKIEQLSSGVCPIFEEELPELLAKNLAAGAIRFTTKLSEGVRAASVVFFVSTPRPESTARQILGTFLRPHAPVPSVCRIDRSCS